jgi:HAE1 family hydrophobic/amphiphilic exporter-1
MFRLAKLSLANRSVVALITITIAIFGVISLGSLRQELFPSIEVPQAAVVTAYPGASPTVVDSQVSQVIESALRTQDGVTNTSTTSQANISIVRVSFDFGTTTAQVNERINSALASVSGLPSGVTPKLLSGSLDSIPIVALGVSSKTGDNTELSKNIEEVAKSVLGQISGVRDVTVDGIVAKRVNLTLNTKKMTANGLTQQSITTALQSNGIVIAAGSITDNKGQLSIQSGSPVESLDALRALPLIGTKTSVSSPSASSLASLFGSGAAGATGGMPTGATGGTSTGAGSAAGASGFPSGTSGSSAASALAGLTPTVSTSVVAVKLGDVATVSLDNAPVTSISRVNGKQALSISITKTPDGNSVALSHAVAAALPDLKQKLGNVTITTEFDQAPYVEKSLADLNEEGLLGLGFAIVVILLFLLSLRSTLVTAISIPTSVLITFIGLNFSGFSLNLFTLSALTIAIGRVVDDSIVVIENINRHLSYGEPKKTAILTAVREVSAAITAATITTVAVFLPIALVGGLVGQLFRPFALTFAVALVSSLFVSLTIVPVLAYWFLKSPSQVEELSEKEAKKLAAAAREAEEASERKSWLQRGYLPILRTTQAHPIVTLIAAFVVLILTFGLAGFLKTNFIGNSDSNNFVLTEEVKAGSSLDQQNAASIKLEKILLAEKNVTTILTTVGSAGDGRVAFGAAAGGIQLQVTTKSGIDQLALQKRVLDKAAADKSLGVVKVQQGGSFGSTGTIDIKVTAGKDATLKAGVAAVAKAMKGTKNVSEITNSLATEQRTLEINVNRAKAAGHGLSELAVSGIVAATMNPSSIGKINLDNVSTPIYVVKTGTPKTLRQIRNIAIPTAKGSVALSSIAVIKEVNVPTSVTGEQGNPTATVSLKPVGDNLGGITAEVTKKLAKVNLPAGATATIGGVSKDQADSFGQLGLALLAAIAIVYLVMVATFRSLLQPVLLLTSIPFAATGAIIALLISNTALGVPALIGMLLLVGIVVTNAIVLIDLINQYHEQGMDLRESIMNGARQRLRPILMTALATIFALTPMALGVTGGGGFISRPLAVVVIGGLFSSTVLTLVIVPVLYWLAAGRKERRASRKGAKKAKKTAKKDSSAKLA